MSLTVSLVCWDGFPYSMTASAMQLVGQSSLHTDPGKLKAYSPASQSAAERSPGRCPACAGGLRRGSACTQHPVHPPHALQQLLLAHRRPLQGVDSAAPLRRRRPARATETLCTYVLPSAHVSGPSDTPDKQCASRETVNPGAGETPAAPRAHRVLSLAQT